MKVKLELDDQETRAVWETAQRAKAEVASWPAWNRGEDAVALTSDDGRTHGCRVNVRCEVGDSVASPRTRCHRIVVETRAVEHPKRADAHWHPPRAGGKGKWVDDPGGHGPQIVRELRACDDCAAKATALERRGEPQVLEERAA